MRFVYVASLFLICGGSSSVVFGEFSRTAAYSVDSATGISRGPTGWLTPRGRGWSVRDESFAELSNVNLGNGKQFGSIDYDAYHDCMVTTEYDSFQLVFSSMSGSPLSSVYCYSDVSTISDLSVDPRDGTIWVSRYGGNIEHLTPQGGVLESFFAGFNVKGIAFDHRRETMFIMRSDSSTTLDDQIYEFNFLGQNLGLIVPADAVPENGLALEYLPATGSLYVASSGPSSQILVFGDSTRVPEPHGVGVLLLVAWQATARLHRRCTLRAR